MASTTPDERIARLEQLLDEANETLDAIRNGEVDAIVVGGTSGQFVYTLQNADRPYRVLVEQMKEGAVTLNERGLLLYVNHSFAELVGRSAGDLVGTSLYDYVTDPARIEEILTGREAATIEMSLRNTEGLNPSGPTMDASSIVANLSIVELKVESGATRMFCGIFTDLSEMRRAADALRQAQKMDAVGQLTGGIAHDFNNLLMAISSSLAMLEKYVPADPQVRRLIDNAQQGATRGAALTQRMLAFARRQDLKQERVDIPSLVEGMLELMQRTLGPAWVIELEFPDALPPVLADTNQVEMALLNLAVNGRDAMPAGGPIRISAEQVKVTGDGPAGLSPGRYICLSVTDRGEGMDAETLARATEPFFTTKGVGKGTGLGLSMVHGLASQLNGTFVLASSPGVGTTACLWLPAATDVVEAGKASVADVTAQPAGRLKVLAVDDDVLIRMNVSAMLEDMGHEVIEAESGASALALIREHPDLDLLITDQAMPNMTGTQLIEHVVAEFPQLPVILASGYGELQTDAKVRITKLGKPFNDQQLARAVDCAMAPSLDDGVAPA